MASIGSIASVFCTSHKTIEDHTEVGVEVCYFGRAAEGREDEQLHSWLDEHRSSSSMDKYPCLEPKLQGIRSKTGPNTRDTLLCFASHAFEGTVCDHQVSEL